MATLPFEPKVAGDSTRKVVPRVLRTEFGDGYSQRAADGLNNNPSEWNLRWELDDTDTDTLIAFFITHGGHTTFEWTPPRESTSQKFIIIEWGETPYGESGSIVTARISQEYDS